MSLRRQIENIAEKELQRSIRKLKRQFAVVKKKHTSIFLNHPVTQAMISSGDAGMLNGVGDLNSFFGISTAEAQDNINEVLKIYEESYVSSAGQAKTSSGIHIYMPSKEEVFAATPLSWAKGRSWAEGVEKGFAGFGYFLDGDGTGKFAESRSGKGIQIKNRLRSGSAGRRRYISALLIDFYAEAEKILNTI